MCKLKLEFNPFIIHKTYKLSPTYFPLILNEEQFLLEDLQVKVFVKIYSLNQELSHTLHQRLSMAQFTEQAFNAYVVLLFIKFNNKTQNKNKMLNFLKQPY